MRSLAILCFVSMVVASGPFSASAKDAAAAPEKEAATGDVPTALQDYVKAKDDAFAWKILGTDNVEGCTIYDVDLTSQVWQGITWKHALTAFVPPDVRHEDTVLLFIMGGSNGGKPGKDELEMGRKLAELAQMPVVLLHQVPNQPLLENKKEDDLISETFVKYLETKDATWPLLFPMVKSAVRAMDAIQEIAEKEHGTTIKQFVVTGGSKRGWTTWLSAVADKRVAGIAPIVIDTLNMQSQMKHQMETWGTYSEQIADYTSKGLVEVMQKQPEIPLWRWVDPYTYRSELKLPKLLVNGTNDRYWVIDAMNLYWDGLEGEKHVLYVPNAGHGLDGGREAALTTVAVFAQNVAMNTSLPDLNWIHDDDAKGMRLVVRSKPAPKAMRLWVAHSDDKDFRPDRWDATELSANGDGEYVGHVEKPASGHVAFFAEATYPFGPIEYNLSTQMRQE
jgi:PhoPQ-activated pathogenicity-related protein